MTVESKYIYGNPQNNSRSFEVVKNWIYPVAFQQFLSNPSLLVCKYYKIKMSQLLNPQQRKSVCKNLSLEPQLNHASLFSLLPYILQPYCLHSKAVPTQLEDKPSLSADKVWCHWLLHPLFISRCLLGCQRLLATAGR